MADEPNTCPYCGKKHVLVQGEEWSGLDEWKDSSIELVAVYCNDCGKKFFIKKPE
jgi:DNA-directed RNA polymerase subunit RPC12/RpoP